MSREEEILAELDKFVADAIDRMDEKQLRRFKWSSRWIMLGHRWWRLKKKFCLFSSIG